MPSVRASDGSNPAVTASPTSPSALEDRNYFAQGPSPSDSTGSRTFQQPSWEDYVKYSQAQGLLASGMPTPPLHTANLAPSSFLPPLTAPPPPEPEQSTSAQHQIPRPPMPASEPVAMPPPAAPAAPAAASTSASAAGGSSPKKERIGRPPNAWILYRSDMLRAIANGERPPGLDAVISDMGQASKDNMSEDSEPPKMKKGKKGTKEPSAIMLQIGRGKGGRGLPQADISKMISVLWKRETVETRKKYEQMSEMKKLEVSTTETRRRLVLTFHQHQQKYPDYKFQPVRKEEKLAMRAERQREREDRRREKERSHQRERGECYSV